MSSFIHLIEVGPRDGLQNEAQFVPTSVKVDFVNALSEAGLKEIEVSSFVSPKWVPQLADAEEVFRSIRRYPGVIYSALVPNEKGLERALAVGVDKISVFTAASETFTQKNINCSIEESLQRFEPVLRSSPVPVRAYISTAFFCPYEGEIDPLRVSDLTSRLLDMGCSEIAVSDTIGKATPEHVGRVLDKVMSVCPVEKLALHFHDTYGNAIANALLAEGRGIYRFDGSAGGIGGCPYAPGAPGNVATEALIEAFPSRTGVDAERIRRCAEIVKPYLTKKGGE
jgi:hydroxymethylglutaryl-CoA lyase